MEKKDITDEMDIYLLIDTFYDRILKNEILSHFFQHAIENWPQHKQLFVKYWCKQILFKDSYDGSPLHTHIAVDHMYGKGFRKSHFDEWAHIWKETVHTLFEGNKAALAIEAGQNMAKNIYLKMFVNRPSRESPYDELKQYLLKERATS